MGNAASEMQHIANQLQGSGTEEKKFMEAVYEGRHDAAAAALKSNPNLIYARTRDWHNAWHLAAKAGSLNMIEVLQQYGRSGTRKPLPGEPPAHSAKTKEGETPLMVACAEGHLNVMQLLMAIGASVTDGDRFGNTVLHYAALRGQVKILEILLASSEAAGSQGGQARFVDLRNEAGLQPLHFAVWGGHEAAVRVLLAYAADLCARSASDSMAQLTCNAGSTPLHIAALRNSIPMANLLLEAYCRAVRQGHAPKQDPRVVPDNYKYTPHVLAINLGRADVAPLLDPAKQLDVGPAADGQQQAADGGLRRSSSRRPSSASGPKPVAPAAADVFDGFSELAAVLPGAAPAAKAGTSPAASSSRLGAAVVPALAPPPPAGSRLAAAAAPLTPPPPPGSKTLKSGAVVAPPPPAASASAAAAALAAAPALPPGHSAAASPSAPPAAASSASTSSTQSAASSGTGGGSSSAPPPAPPPSRALCPITQQVMNDPVVAGDGRSYERDAVEMWIALGNSHYPGGEVGIRPGDAVALRPDDGLKGEIEAWRQAAAAAAAAGK